MKALPYIIIGIACFALGWLVRPDGRHPAVKTDTIQAPPIVVTQTKVDTLLLVSPLPYIAWLTGDTIEVDGCRHAKEQKMYTDDSTYTAWVSGVRPSLDTASACTGRRNTLIATSTVILSVSRNPSGSASV